MKFGSYSEFAFVDVETTGTNPISDRILEIGIIRVSKGKIVGELNTLVNPNSFVPKEITQITGITEKDIEFSPYFGEVYEAVRELLDGAIFVAHNARFDYAFVKHEFRRLGKPLTNKTLCTVKLSRNMFPQKKRHNLDEIIGLLGITVINRHRAYDDAKVLHTFLEYLHASFDENSLNCAILKLLKSPSLPRHIKKSDIDKIPESPGVYLMYGENDFLLYIGKSVDIRSRVMSHFTQDFESQKDIRLTREVRRVDFQVTSGDFEASILESSLIKSLRPLYNRMLRGGKNKYFVIQREKNGYLHPSLEKEVSPSDIDKILWVESSIKSYKEKLSEKAKEHSLCGKLLGLEKGGGKCFFSQIGICKGVCVGMEPNFKYNTRFIEAFSGEKVPLWPYSGPVGFKETFYDKETLHIMHNWCYLGAINETDNENEIYKVLDRLEFEWDNYLLIRKLIKRYGKTPQIFTLPFEASRSFPIEQL